MVEGADLAEVESVGAVVVAGVDPPRVGLGAVGATTTVCVGAGADGVQPVRITSTPSPAPTATTRFRLPPTEGR